MAAKGPRENITLECTECKKNLHDRKKQEKQYR